MTGRSRLANDAWESLLTVHATLMKGFAARDIWRDLSMREYDVLYALTRSPEPVRLTDLHRRVLLSQPALSRLVDRLVARGLVARSEDADDRRVSRLALTADGRARQREVGRAHARDVAAAMTATGVSDADLATLMRITRALLGTGEERR